MMKEKSDTENLWNTKNPIEFAEKKIGIKLDEWQKKYIQTEGNVAVRAGRQSGKSFAQSLRVALFALLNRKTQTLIIGAVDRQSVELFEKVKSHIQKLAKWEVKGRPTMHKIELKNGSRIIALPAGRTGYGLRNYTIHKLVADEAHYIPEEVWTAVRPMLATTNGTMDLLSTPRGNVGFFFECFQSDDFTTFHTTSYDCPRITKEFLDGEKKRMTKLQFAQEYLAEFLDALQQFFTKELIDSCIDEDIPQVKVITRDMFLGIDLAGWGGDENAFASIDGTTPERSVVRDIQTTERVSAWDTVQMIKNLNHHNKYSKIGLDDGGIGSAILDFCLKEDELKRKTEGLNNARRQVDRAGNKSKTLLKEDMYGNLKLMMEQCYIKFPYDENLIRSLLSIQFEKDEKTGKYRIHGRYTHITEALIRAAWLIKKKALKLYVY